jgi:agmatinase
LEKRQEKYTAKPQEGISAAENMADEFAFGNFLGLPENGDSVDVVVLQIPYELTTSYGQGTAQGPAACIEASSQVELFDPVLGEDMPAEQNIFTAPAWSGEGPNLLAQLDGISNYLSPWFIGDCFPIILGGEHGILPPIVNATRKHPLVERDLSNLTIVQIDAHADLREELDGEKYSHACAASRSLDLGIKHLFQAGIRAYSKLENERIESDERITTYFARDTQSDMEVWKKWIITLENISGPVHLTLDIDGLDGSLVPATGTPVPGGLSFWQVSETIDALFRAKHAVVISVDVNEIVPQKDTPLTQFTAAMIATKALAAHIMAKRAGLWEQTTSQQGKQRNANDEKFFISQGK